jgi:hypothetical protein
MALARRRRAAVSERLMAGAPQAVASLDWDTLDQAPHWLALPEAELTTFQCQVGAVLCAGALRLWIDKSRLAAAQTAVGALFLRKLLAQPEAASIAIGLVECPEIDTPGEVEAMLRLTGASVLLASLVPGALREAADAALAPITASTMAQELALTLVSHAQWLREHATLNPAAPPASLADVLSSVPKVDAGARGAGALQ